MAYSATRTDDAMAHAPTRSEVQTLTVTGTPTGGNFNISYDGQTTGAIAYNASAANVDTALEALSNIGAGDVTCAGGPLPGTAVTVTFATALASTNVALMTADSTNLTGGTTPTASIATTTTGYGSQKVTINAAIDTFGAAVDTLVTDTSMSAAEAEEIYDLIYKIADKIGSALRDQLT
jgi:hypothetical protein